MNKKVKILMISTIICSLVFGGFAWFGIGKAGMITGRFIGFETYDWGDECGQYPFTRIFLKNSFNIGIAGPDNFRDEIEFFGYHPELKNLIKNNTYSFFYHASYRQGDADPMLIITEYNLDFWWDVTPQNCTEN